MSSLLSSDRISSLFKCWISSGGIIKLLLFKSRTFNEVSLAILDGITFIFLWLKFRVPFFSFQVELMSFETSSHSVAQFFSNFSMKSVLLTKHN